MKLYLSAFFAVIVFANAYSETLFEVKDSSNNKVLDISTDGLRVMNQGDTLMVISSNEIKANISSSKGLSRTFSVTTNSAKGKGLINALEVDAGSATMTSPDGKYTDFSPDNIFLGLNAGIATTPSTYSGHSNIFLGNDAGVANVLGQGNVFIGMNAGNQNVNGGTNVMIGALAGQTTTQSEENIFIGYKAGDSSTGGDQNVYLGAWTGGTWGSQNVLLGNMSGRNNSGSGNVFLGYRSGYNETGSNRLYIENSDISSPLIYGEFDTDYVEINGDIDVTGNADIGGTLEAGNTSVLGTFSATGSSVIDDYLTLDYGTSINEFSTDGTLAGNSDNAVPTERAVKTYVGSYVGSNGDNLGNHIATQNIRLSGYYLSNDGGNEGVFVSTTGNVGIGTNDPGSNRLKVTGYSSGITGATGYFENSYSTGIGLAAFATSTDCALYAEQKNTSSATAKIAKFASRYGGTWYERFNFMSTGRFYAPYLASGTGTALVFTTGGEIVKYSSSKKYKKNIESLVVDREKFMKLRPVDFVWNEKSATEGKKDKGLIAEEVEKIDPELAVYDDDGNIEGVDYQKVNIMLLKVVQEQQLAIEEMRREIEKLKSKN